MPQLSIKVVGKSLDCGVYALFPATSYALGIPSKEQRSAPASIALIQVLH